MVSMRVCIDVDDLGKAVTFFENVFGLRRGRTFDQQWVELLGASCPIDLLANAADSPAVAGHDDLRTKRDYGRHWTPVHLDFEVDDIDATVERAIGAGATLERPIQTRPYGRLANLADPFGNGLCLLEMNERGYDALLSAPEPPMV